MKHLWVLLAVGAALLGCHATGQPAKGPRSGSSSSLGPADIEQIVALVVRDVLADTTLEDQATVPLKVEGFSGQLPEQDLGKPVLEVDDVDAFLGDHYKVDDIATNNVLALRLLEENEQGLRISAFHSRGWAGCTSVELWLARAGTAWRVASVVSRQEML